ncbi:hypothetical protein P3T40_009095, partial [Paraburkholderia sp. EB58]|uniref:hypothetical protein n=1 Tax=Paraburkholderia sp. EB58 TaxID=3035125 RepID=UPI003D1D3528
FVISRKHFESADALKHVGLHPLGGFLGWGNFGLTAKMRNPDFERVDISQRFATAQLVPMDDLLSVCKHGFNTRER